MSTARKRRERGKEMDPRLEEFIARTILHTVQDLGQFEPASIDDEEIARLGLPPRPDAETQPIGHSFWMTLFQAPLKLQQPKFALSNSGSLRPSLGAASRGTSIEGSVNWSGPYISPREGRIFTAIRGGWSVPDPALPAAAPALTHASSAWIGLDGQRRYLHSSLPQIGTAHVIKPTGAGPVRKLSTWVQWWVRDNDDNLPIDLCLPVAVGDRIYASIDRLSPTLVRFSIRNLTTGLGVWPFDVMAPKAKMPTMPSPMQLEVSGATADWILERPTDPVTQVIQPLPDYGQVEFTDCHAVAWDRETNASIEQALPGARLIQMYETRTNPSRTAVISKAFLTGDSTALTRYNLVP